MSVIPLRAHPQVPIVYRDRTERSFEAVGELDAEDGVSGMLMELGYRLCDGCETWCEPVRVEPAVACGRCELVALAQQIRRGLHLMETPEELALRVYNHFIVPASEPPRAS